MDDNDVHQHRRNGDPEDLQAHRLQAAADSSTAKIVARLVMPALLSLLLGVSAYIGTRLVDQLDAQGRDIASVRSDVRDLNTRMTEGVIRQVNSNSSRIDDHEKRIQTLERTVKTP